MSTPQKSGDAGKKTPDTGSKNITRDFGPFLTLGLQLAISVVVFFFLGYWLDGKFGTAPWCTIGGAFLGAAGGLFKFLKEAVALGRQADQDMKDQRDKKLQH